MDIQNAATTLMNLLGENPGLISQLAEHPYSTTAQATGTDERISQQDMSQILTQVASMVSGSSYSDSQVSGIASNLLGQNNNSVHSLASSLFGSISSSDVSSMVEIAAKSAIGGVVAKGLASILTSALGANKPAKK